MKQDYLKEYKAKATGSSGVETERRPTTDKRSLAAVQINAWEDGKRA